MKRAMKNILVVDSDLGFILWLGRVLLGTRQQLLPACNVSDAMALVGEPAEPVDLLIIDSSLPHSADLIARLRGSQAQLKVLALDGKGKGKLPHVHPWRREPGQPARSAELRWKGAVKSLLSSRNQRGGSRTSAKHRSAS